METWCSIWPELIKGLPAVVVTLVLGLFALHIQRRQHQTALAKFNLDLFEKRLKLFDLVWEYVSARSNAISEDWVRDLHANLQNSQHLYYFLFDKPVGEYVHQVLERGTDHNAQLRKTQKMKRDDDILATEQRIIDLETWFRSESIDIRRRFDQYLQFRAWGSDI